MVKKIYSKHYSPPPSRVFVKNLIERKLIIPLLAGLVFAAVVAGFTIMRQNNVTKNKNTSKSLVFTRQLIGKNQFAGEIKGVMKTALATEKNGGRITVSRGESRLEFAIPIDNPTLNSQNVGILQSSDVSFASKDKIVSAKYNLVPNGIKEEIIMNKIPQENRIAMTMKTENLQIKLNPDNIPVFYDLSGAYQFHFERPYVKDGTGAISYGVKYQFINQDGKNLELFKSNNGKDVKHKIMSNNVTLPVGQYTLIIEIDSGWLHDPKRVLPITIDPTVIHDESSEFAAGQFNRAKDTGSGSSPILETYYQELANNQSTIGLWHLNEASGNALDSSGNGNTGTATGTTVISGKFNNGRSFNGTSDKLNVVNDLGDPNQMSISLWFNKSNTNAGTQYIADARNGGNWWYIQDYEGGTLCITDTGGNVCYDDRCMIPSSYLKADTWHNVVVTDNSISCNIYLDGKHVMMGTGEDPSIGANLRIATRFTDSGFFNGMIDEFAIFDKILTAEEIQSAAARSPYSVYTSDVVDLLRVSSWNSLTWTELGVATGDGETPKDSTSLVAQWNFNETSGTTADNAAGSCGASCDGTLTGFSSTGSQDSAASTGWTSNNKRWGAGALMFDGTDDNVSAGTVADLKFTGDFSLEAWVKPSGSTVGQIVSSGVNSDWMYLLGGATVSSPTCKIYQANSGSGYLQVDGKRSITDGDWHHVVCTLSGTTLSLYIDGVLEAVSSTTTGSRDVSSAGTFTIGKFTNATSSYYAGLIDTVRAYSRAISSTEILSNYNSSNLEFQTRVGNSTDPNDGSWEIWSPTASETQIDSFDSGESGNWQYRKSISISHTGSAVTEYQVLIDNLDTATLISGGKMQTDCDDIRFTNSSGALLPYSIVGNTCNTSSTQIWVQVDSIPASGGATIYMFYGNTGANSYSNETETFSYSSEKTVAYVLDNDVNQLELISYQPDNTVTHNSITRTLDKYATSNFTSISQFGAISAKKPFNADDLSDDTDGIVPVSWAGTEFLFIARSTATYSFYTIAPWSNATVDVYHAGTDCTGNSVTSSGTTINCAVTAGAVRITSTTPVLIFSETTTTDPTVLRPSSTGKWIGTGQTSYVTSNASGADYRYFSSANASETDPANLGADATASIGGGAFGAAPALLTRSIDNPIGVNQYGDGDGSDGHMHMGLVDMGTIYGSAVTNTDYISIASDKPATCTVYNASTRAQISSGTATSSNSSVYFLGFGTGASTSIVAAPWYMECNYQVAATYQKGADSESKLSSVAMMRQFTYPTPSVGSPGSEDTLSSHSGSWVTVEADRMGLLSPTLDTNTKIEGTGSQKLTTGTQISDANTVGLWHMDETGGTGAYIKDSSINANHGTPTGTTSAEGITRKSRSFNGSGDVITVPDHASLDTGGTFSIEAWVYPLNLTARYPIYSTRFANPAGSWQLEIGPGNGGTARVSVTGVGTWVFDSVNNAVIPNQWNHIAYTRASNANVGTMYVNGQSVGATSTAVYTITDNNDVKLIGATNYPGLIDEVKHSNIARTADEIAESYRMGRNHYINKTISSVDLSSKSSLPFYVAADRPGTYLQATVGESAYSIGQPDASTVGLWHLEEHTGSGAYLKDSSNNPNHGTPTGTTFRAGKIGNTRYFNGSSDYTDMGDPTQVDFGTGNFSLEAWTKRDTVGATQMIISKDSDSTGRQFFLAFLSTNNLRISYITAGGQVYLDSTATIADNNWHHIVGQRNGNSFDIYIDGKLTDSGTTGGTHGTMQAVSTPLRLGQRPYTGNLNYFHGSIDEARISNVARTADEIRQTYEYGLGLRSHPVTIDFAAKLDTGNLIANSADLGFTIDATVYGSNNKGDYLYSGDKIIVRENYDGTEYIAQGTVTSVNSSTGAVTVDEWDTGATFPSGGYTVNADVFKWQREYWNITEPLDNHLNAITNLTLRLTDGAEGRIIWLDDLKSASDYLTTPGGSTIISSTGYRYFQYRVIEHSSDENVSASLTSVTLDYVQNSKPNPPQQDSPADTATNQSLTPILRMTATDINSDYLRYQIELCEDAIMTSNCQTFDQTSSQTGWSGQNTESNTAYTSGTQASYTIQSSLDPATTYYWQAIAVDPGGVNQWSDYSDDVFSFTTTSTPSSPTTPYTEGSSNPTGVADTTPEFSAVVSDPDGDSANYYRIEVNTQSDFLGTSMWDSGKASMTSTANGVRSPDISYAGTSIPLDGAGTTYYWRIKFWDVNGAEGPYTTAQSFAMNVKPGTPTLDLPADTATNQSLLTSLKTTATDTESNNLRYKIEICTNSGMTSNCQTFDQTSSQTGWSGQNADTNTTYTSGTQATYNIQSALSPATTYYWRSYATDPGGSNTWSATQGTPYSFTTTSTDYPTQCRIEKSVNNDSVVVKWNDNSTNEVNYEIQKNTDGGGFSLLQTLAANSVSHQDNSVSNGHTYQYRVAVIFTGSQYSQWCTTSTITLGQGNLHMEGINLE